MLLLKRARNDYLCSMKLNKKIFEYFKSRQMQQTYILQGGRRSGKTFAICQRLLLLCYAHRRIVNIATMTMEQGRLGAYSDMKQIIENEPLLQKCFDIKITPREIANKYNGSRIFFNSYQNSETAKGVACDYLFVNEANNFSKQQYIDLLANVRLGVFLDYNPNIQFWVDEFFKPEDILITTWRDNPFLSDLQKQYFAQLKMRAFSEEATSMDLFLYKVYYLGEHSEVSGDLFTPYNIRTIEELPPDCRTFVIFCDPSAMVGNDFFAIVLATYSPAKDLFVIVDTFSVNNSNKEFLMKMIKAWCLRFDDVVVYVETNGIIGADFFQYAGNSGLDVVPWYSHRKKFDRILASYEDIVGRTAFLEQDRLQEFLEQVYTFGEKCEHDDNIDAVNSAITVLKTML